MDEHQATIPQAAQPAPTAMLQAYQNGDSARVIELGQQARRQGLAGEASECLLGVAELGSGRFEDAVTTFTGLTRRAPRHSAYWNNLGIALRQQGQLEPARDALQHACRLAPADAQAHYNLGLVHRQRRHWLDMREAMLAACQRAPALLHARLQAAHACHRVGDTESVAELLADAGRWPALAADDALHLASLLATVGRIDTAVAVLDIASSHPSGPAEQVRLQAQRVLLHERGNRLEPARRLLQSLPEARLDALPKAARAARLDGHHAHAAMALRERDAAGAARHYQRMLDHADDDSAQATAAFGLAAARDRQGQPAAAWAALALAHAAQQRQVAEIRPELLYPDVPPLEMQPQPLPATAASWRQGPTTAIDSPVFVVGFPRSGTTLLEQMLDAHPGFQALDERPFVHELVQRMQQAGQRYPHALGSLDEDDANALRQIYRQLAHAQLGPGNGTRIVDKNPLNMLLLPMIVRLFPHARIVLCLRHPGDVLLSNYFQPFRAPAFMAMCASLERLAEGYRLAFERWLEQRAVLDPVVLEWRYEAVVADLPGHLDALARFLKIDDPAPMAGYARHAAAKTFIGTPSYAQVTEALHGRSIGRWQGYRPHFTAQVLAQLQPVAARLGYSMPWPSADG